MRAIDEVRYRQLRRELHSDPELGFDEFRTAERVAAFLNDLGVEVHRNIAKTGVVGVIRKGSGARSIALRADMDALPIAETNEFAHRSHLPQVMHACGHDGHIVMLLAAAEQLVAAETFDGTVVLVFQPAEEGGGGAKLMLAEGLFERFPVDAVFGLHNWPGLQAGSFGVLPGPVMACADHFDIQIHGAPGHAGLPHNAIDSIVVGAQLVAQIQTIVSRELAPQESAAVTITQFHSGDTYNVIPATATLRGTVRTCSPASRDHIEPALARICEGVAASYRAKIELKYSRDYSPIVNSTSYVDACAAAAADVVGNERVLRTLAPSMAAEDFSSLLEARPGCYVWIGNGPTDKGCFLHSSTYDFNDEIISTGASYWVRLVEHLMPTTTADISESDGEYIGCESIATK